MPAFIALDWGTTTFRAYLMDAAGAILAQASSDAGILHCRGQGFATALQRELATFAEAGKHLPIVAAGMITSRNGWVETSYLPCPAGLPQLAAALKQLTLADGRSIWFCPGVCQRKPHADIMRGEETQIAGLDLPADSTVLLPGTHSKWVRIEQGTIAGFTTFMTGDLYAAVTAHTILQDSGQDWNDDLFCEALQAGKAAGEGGGQGILGGLFQIRARQLLEQATIIHTRDWVSGFLIGAEIGEAMKTLGHASFPLVIVANAKLAARYQMALNYFGVSSRLAPPDTAAQGLYRIARLKGLV